MSRFNGGPADYFVSRTARESVAGLHFDIDIDRRCLD